MKTKLIKLALSFFSSDDGRKFVRNVAVVIVSPFVALTVLSGAIFSDGISLFIVDFKLRKPSNAFLAVLVILVACAVIAIFLFSKYHISLCFPGLENSILDRLMR